MGTIFATEAVRPGASRTRSRSTPGLQHQQPGPSIIGANGHFHSRGKQFDIYTWDGTPSRPPEAVGSTAPMRGTSPDAALEISDQVPAKGGVFYTCSYDLATARSGRRCKGLDDYDQTKYMTPVRTSTVYVRPDRREERHCNIFVYYYPKQTTELLLGAPINMRSPSPLRLPSRPATLTGCPSPGGCPDPSGGRGRRVGGRPRRDNLPGSSSRLGADGRSFSPADPR
jgi:hypothetical protein